MAQLKILVVEIPIGEVVLHYKLILFGHLHMKFLFDAK